MNYSPLIAFLTGFLGSWCVIGAMLDIAANPYSRIANIIALIKLLLGFSIIIGGVSLGVYLDVY